MSSREIFWLEQVRGRRTISAISGGAAVASTGALKILVECPPPSAAFASAPSPTLLPANGGASTITAQVLDVNGNALTSAPVSFSTTAGTLDQGLVTTDQSRTRDDSSENVVGRDGHCRGRRTGQVRRRRPQRVPPGTPATPATSGQASGTVDCQRQRGAHDRHHAALDASRRRTSRVVCTIAVTAPAASGSAIRDVTVNWGDGQNARSRRAHRKCGRLTRVCIRQELRP